MNKARKSKSNGHHSEDKTIRLVTHERPIKRRDHRYSKWFRGHSIEKSNPNLVKPLYERTKHKIVTEKLQGPVQV